jgi:hypothetical protein
MDKSIEKLIDEVLNLPNEMKAYLAEKILENLDTDTNADISNEWRDEIYRRCAEIDSGIAVLKDSDKVFQETFKRLK